MGKTGIGATNVDKEINLSTRGLINAISVEMVDASGRQVIPASGFNIPAFDYIALSYSGANLILAQYKNGGVSGSVVATLTLAYDASGNLTSVAKS